MVDRPVAGITDLLADADWFLASTAAGTVTQPQFLGPLDLDWTPAQVPGTVAGALRAVGRWRAGEEDEDLLDGRDWWYRCRVRSVPQGLVDLSLCVDGVATIADVWLGASHVLHSENMFVSHRIRVGAPAAGDEIVIRICALTPLLSKKHPRPRWKSRLVRSQSIRWYRTSLLGRMPGWSRWAAPVGPWRPVRLEADVSAVTVGDLHLEVLAVGDGGRVVASLVLRCPSGTPERVALGVDDQEARLAVTAIGDGLVRAEGTIELAAVERWWPHTHGPATLHRAWLRVDDTTIEVGRIGFRTIDVDQEDGNFTVYVNKQKIFCRGACWNGVDSVSLVSDYGRLRTLLEEVRAAGMNMLRVSGYALYEGETFWDICDELGILVWQDAMIASVDPPETAEYQAALSAELTQLFGSLQRHPALAVFCGSSESYQQAAMYGLPTQRWRNSTLDEVIPSLLQRLLPTTGYVASSPSGGDMPFSPDSGVSHYFGVGPYLRPLADAKLAGVRFAAECLSFSIPPEPQTVRTAFGGSEAAGHASAWKSTVARDAGTSWDFEDVRNYYVREIFGLDPLLVRYSDPDWALDLGRAAVTHAMSTVLTEWRRDGSTCAGALILTLKDLWPGAGWGLLDSLGQPKAPWYAVRRVFAPIALLATDDGLSGLRLHAFNDTNSSFTGRVRVTVFSAQGGVIEDAEQPIVIQAHSEQQLSVEQLLGGFRDLTRAYRFSPATQDVVLGELIDADGSSTSSVSYLPGGVARRLPELGLRAWASRSAEGWTLTVSSQQFAQYVAIDIPEYVPSDSWFHLVPGESRSVQLAGSTTGIPRGHVRALNATTDVPISVRSDNEQATGGGNR